MTQVLIGRQVSFEYNGRRVVDGADVCVRPGRATILVGASGSGKTTLLWLLAGLLKPASGTVGICPGGKPPSSSGVPIPGALSEARLGMVFQQPSLWDHLTAEQHLSVVLGGRHLSSSAVKARVDSILAKVHLEGLRRRRPYELSGGERQRLALARALIVQPQWLFLDEPLAHLDGSARSEMLDVLRDCLRGAGSGVLMATHSAAEAMRLADEVVIVADGRTIQSGPADVVYRQPSSLLAARILGPAVEVEGEARGGILHCQGRALLTGLDPKKIGLLALILRAEDVSFQLDLQGPCEATRCDFSGGRYVISARIGDTVMHGLHPQPVAIGSRGRFVLAASHCATASG